MKRMMRHDCFAWMGEVVNDDGIMYTKNEKCFCLTVKECTGCRFFKDRDTVIKHKFMIYQTPIVEWIPK